MDILILPWKFLKVINCSMQQLFYSPKSSCSSLQGLQKNAVSLHWLSTTDPIVWQLRKLPASIERALFKELVERYAQEIT